jgi:hypothetical protein
MAHFARVEDGIVREVIVVSNCDIGGCVGEENVPASLWIPEHHINCGDAEFPETETLGQAFIASIGLAGEWLQTSYSLSFRGTYAGIGYTFDADLDEFVATAAPEVEALITP